MMSQQKTKNKKPVGSRIISGLEAFRDTLRDRKPLEKRFTVRSVELDLQPHEYGPEAVRTTREQLSISQALFAQLLGVSVDTVQAWEQGRREPSKMARRFMDEIRHNPKHWIDRLREAATESSDHLAPC